MRALRIALAFAALLAALTTLAPAAAAGSFTSVTTPFTGVADFVTALSSCNTASGVVGPTGLAFDSTSFYVDDWCMSTIYKFPLSGGTAATPIARGANGLTQGIAVQQGYYYGRAS